MRVLNEKSVSLNQNDFEEKKVWGEWNPCRGSELCCFEVAVARASVTEGWQRQTKRCAAF